MPDARAVKRAPRRRLPAERVTIDFVLLADYAQAINGKLTVVGAGWNILNATQYPFPVAFGLGIGFLVPWSETNRKHSFKFLVRKSEGAQLVDGGGDFEIGREPGIPNGMTQRVVMGISGQLQVTEPGTYEIQVLTGEEERHVTFEAKALGGRQ
jgi:hypothetical protein